MTGNFGHFFVYAPPDKHEAREYGASRYGMEVQRISDMIEKHLAEGNKTWIVGNEYSVAGWF
jgi:glutathione S-transferase